MTQIPQNDPRYDMLLRIHRDIHCVIRNYAYHVWLSNKFQIHVHIQYFQKDLEYVYYCHGISHVYTPITQMYQEKTCKYIL